MVLSELRTALDDLERVAHEDMTNVQTSIWGEDPGHIVLMHARYLGAAFSAPREAWNWGLIRESWNAILRRRHIPFVESWLHRHEHRIAAYLAQNGLSAASGPLRLTDRLGRVHTLQRA
jgi:hypothetical protein